LYDLWLAENPAHAPSTENSLSLDERTIRKFLKDFKWLDHIQQCGLSRDDMLSLHTKQPSDASTRNYLTRTVTDMLADMQDILQGDPFLRYQIGRRPPTEHAQTEVVSHKIVRPETLMRYATYIAALIIFLRRVSETEYRLFIPPELLSDINEVCILTEQQEEEYAPTLTPEEEDALEEVPMEPLDEHGEPINNTSNQDQPIPDPDSLDGQHPLPMFGPTQIKIRSIIRYLLFQTPQHSFNAQFHSPIMHYLVVSSTRKDDGWAPTTHITQKIAGLACVLRLVFSDFIIESSFENKRLHAK
jgi:hypothetical protein